VFLVQALVLMHQVNQSKTVVPKVGGGKL